MFFCALLLIGVFFLTSLFLVVGPFVGIAWHASSRPVIPSGGLRIPHVSSVRIRRRAVVMVGGDFARSPRMQYHAVSLRTAHQEEAGDGGNRGEDHNDDTLLVHEVFLVGLSEGNQLCDDLAVSSAAPVSARAFSKSSSSARAKQPQRIADVCSRGLIPPPVAPQFLQRLAKSKKPGALGKIMSRVGWVLVTAYRVLYFLGSFTTVLWEALTPSVRLSLRDEDKDGTASTLLDWEVTIPTLVFCQTPPAVPFIPLLRLIRFLAAWPLRQSWMSLCRRGILRAARVVFPFLEPGPKRATKKEEEEVVQVVTQCSSNRLQFCIFQLTLLLLREYEALHQSGRLCTATSLCNVRHSEGKQTPQNRGKAVAKISSGFRRPLLLIDWHNFGYSLLRVDGRPAILVALYKFLESTFCEGDVNLTVSQAMRSALGGTSTQNVTTADRNSNKTQLQASNNSNVPTLIALQRPPHVLYDTAPAFFQPSERTPALLDALQRSLPNEQIPSWFVEECRRGGDTPQQPRPSSSEVLVRDTLFLVSSTSWGADDDYGMVIEALKLVRAQFDANPRWHATKKIWLLATGKGATRAAFEQLVIENGFDLLSSQKGLPSSRSISVSTAFFQSYRDYSAALGSADVGLSVHFSSSGLDLPMKCVDMMGCGLPVLAVAYQALDELVHDEVGWKFDSAAVLAAHIVRLMTSEEGARDLIAKRDGVRRERKMWQASWNEVVLPLVA